jgi:hypothetical protein
MTEAMAETYQNFQDFADKNGIHLQRAGMLTAPNERPDISKDDTLIAAIAGQASRLPGGVIALNQTYDTAVVALGEQTSDKTGVMKYFVFDKSAATVYSYDSNVTVNPDGSVSMDMAGGTSHPFQSQDERSAYDRMRDAFNARSDIAQLQNGTFAKYAQQNGLPLGGMTSEGGQYRVDLDPAKKEIDLSSCMALSENFGLCSRGVYNETTQTFGQRLDAVAVNGDKAVTASAAIERPMETDEERSKFTGNTRAPGVNTYVP